MKNVTHMWGLEISGKNESNGVNPGFYRSQKLKISSASQQPV